MFLSCNFIHVEPKTFDVQAPEPVGTVVKELNEDRELETMLTEDMPAHSDFSALVNKAPLMIFMNGKPAEPLCEFSRTLIGILWDACLAYDHFDVLKDENVHQGIKTLSNFMTYPQVFVNGVFVGGLDTIKRLKESGDLVEKLKI